MPGVEDRTADFRDAVKRRRSLLGLTTPAADILPPAKKRAAFTTDALSCLEKIATMAGFLRDNHAAYLLDDELRGMSEAERDEIDAETQRFLKACNDRIDGLKQQAVAATAREKTGGQLQTHYQAMLQLLYERLQEVAQVFDVHRGHRLQKAVDAKEARVGAAAAAAVEARRSNGGGSLVAVAAASSTAAMEPAPWGDDEVLSDEDLDEKERTQLLLENEALQKELSCLSQQAREAESKVMEISNLSHLFATKVQAATAPSPGPRARARSSRAAPKWLMHGSYRLRSRRSSSSRATSSSSSARRKRRRRTLCGAISTSTRPRSTRATFGCWCSPFSSPRRLRCCSWTGFMTDMLLTCQCITVYQTQTRNTRTDGGEGGQFTEGGMGGRN